MCQPFIIVMELMLFQIDSFIKLLQSSLKIFFLEIRQAQIVMRSRLRLQRNSRLQVLDRVIQIALFSVANSSIIRCQKLRLVIRSILQRLREISDSLIQFVQSRLHQRAVVEMLAVQRVFLHRDFVMFQSLFELPEFLVALAGEGEMLGLLVLVCAICCVEANCHREIVQRSLVIFQNDVTLTTTLERQRVVCIFVDCIGEVSERFLCTLVLIIIIIVCWFQCFLS